MKSKHILLAATVLAFLSCRRNPEPKPAPPPAADVIRLKDVNIAHLPNPYYHFVYDNAGLITAASYSDSMAFYDVFYNANKTISSMQNKSFGNRDVLKYQYDNGDVSVITITNEAGVTYRHGFFDYNYSHQLINVEWDLKVEGGFLIERTLDLSYTADGNVKDIVTHIHAMDGQPAVTFTTTYSNYDDKKNVDGFSLLHPDQFHHLYLLPGVKLQLNNHRREVRTGGVNNYAVDYTYTYDSKGRPIIQSGDFQWTSGSDSGKHTPLHTDYSYYD